MIHRPSEHFASLREAHSSVISLATGKKVLKYEPQRNRSSTQVAFQKQKITKKSVANRNIQVFINMWMCIYSRVVLKNKETILSLEFRNSKAYVVLTRVQNILFLNFT